MTTTTQINKLSDGTYDRRVREYASDLADMVANGEITDIEANERMVRFQDRIADAPWG